MKDESIHVLSTFCMTYCLGYLGWGGGAKVDISSAVMCFKHNVTQMI